MSLTLVGLAAGAGSRFGGPKQLEPLGPCGETMLDYAIADARAAGFERVVLVIRPEMRERFERGIVARWRPRIDVALALQETDGARGKPWGTVHAVLAAAERIDGPFAVVNADDHYGAASYREVAAFLREVPPESSECAVVGFPLADTLSGAGGVNRAILQCSPGGWLEQIEEVHAIERDGSNGRVRRAGGADRVLPGALLVSMNMWGFTPAILPRFEERFRAFQQEWGGDARAELVLPTCVESLVRAGHVRVRVLRGGGAWCGVTFPEDRASAAAFLREVGKREGHRCPIWDG